MIAQVAGATVEWHCDPADDRPRVYFANHASHLDFVLIWSALPRPRRRQVRPVAGSDYWNRTPVRRFVAASVFHAVLIERGGGPAASRAALVRMAAALDDRQSLIVFPEGTRSRDGGIGEFKSGLFHLTRLRPDVELVPVLLENTGRILPKGEALPVPMLSRVVFGAPLPVDPAEDKHAFLARARGVLMELKDDHATAH
jgi:1-acyl-sn-glycerol-3-phosphate acyltransferase